MLHIINKSPFTSTSLKSCLGVAKSGGAILLIEDGVYAALGNSTVAELMATAIQEHKVYVLKPDADARGLQDKMMEGIDSVDYSGFVELVTNNDTNQSWL